MKQLLATLSLVLISFFTRAQKIDITVNDSIKFRPESPVYQYGNNFISFEQTEVVNRGGWVKLYKQKFKLKLFSQNLSQHLVRETSLSNGSKIYGPYRSSLKKLNGKLYLIYCSMPEESNTSPIHIMAGEIDTISLDLVKPKEILTISHKSAPGGSAIIDASVTDKLQIVESPDKSKILASWSSSEDNSYFYNVLDSNLAVIWSKNESIESADKIELGSSSIDNEENVCLGLYGVSKRSYVGTGHFIVGKKREKDAHFPVAIQEGVPTNLNIVASALDKSVKIVGTYEGANERLSGVFATSLNASKTGLTKVQLTPFTNELLEQLIRGPGYDKWASPTGKDKGIDALIETKAHELQDGSIDMVGMLRRYEGVYSWLTQGSILVAHFNNGQVNFLQLPKFASNTLNINAGKFHAIVKKDTTIVFYNDLVSNMKVGNEHDYSAISTNKIVLAAAIISKGQLIRTIPALDTYSMSSLVLVNWITAINPDTLLLPVLKVKGFLKPTDYSRLAFIKL